MKERKQGWRAAQSSRFMVVLIAIGTFWLSDAAVSTDNLVGSAFTYQGLLNHDGAPADGVFDLEFRLFDEGVGGTSFGSLVAPDLDISDGVFTIDLDFGLETFSGDERWLEIAVDGVTLSPRQPIMPTPYALRALSVDAVSIASLPQAGEWALSNTLNVDAGTLVVNPASNRVGIGTATPTQALHVQGNANVTGWIGTDLNQPVDLYANNKRVLRIADASFGVNSSPNIIGGVSGNFVGDNVVGATISGGGNALGSDFNRITSGHYATIAGGLNNQGHSQFSTIGGGGDNIAGGYGSCVPGGTFNEAHGLHSFAAGSAAKANHNQTFVWNDRFFGADFASTGDYQFLIHAAGGVGINTNAPQKALTVAGDMEIGTSAGDYRHLRVGGGNSSGYLYGSFPYAGDGIHLGYNFYANSGGFGQIINPGGGTSRVSMGYGYIALATNGAGGPLERLYVNGAGNVGIGTSSPAFLLHCNGTAAKPGGGSWTNSSDARLKKNIHDLQGSLDSLLALRGVTYQYIDPIAINELPGQRIGMIAQDVEAVFPDWIESGSNGFKTLTYRGFEALTVEAFRELRSEKDAQIAQQQNQIATIQQHNKHMQDRLAVLEATVRQLNNVQEKD